MESKIRKSTEFYSFCRSFFLFHRHPCRVFLSSFPRKVINSYFLTIAEELRYHTLWRRQRHVGICFHTPSIRYQNGQLGTGLSRPADDLNVRRHFTVPQGTLYTNMFEVISLVDPIAVDEVPIIRRKRE